MFKLEKHVQIPEMGTKMAEILRHFTENGRSNFAMINLSEIIIPNNLSEKHSKNQLNKLIQAILKFGFSIPIIIDERNCLISGYLRILAAKELGLKTAKYFYAKSLDELKAAAEKIGFPCVVKPLMSSSGKGQSLVKSADELEHAWEYGCNGSRGDIKELIIEEFIKFDSEITLLTVTQKNGPTLFCPPIGHVQKGGDYRESFQPAHIDPAHLREAQDMAEKVTRALTGAGLWGVEFFLSHENGVYFS